MSKSLQINLFSSKKSRLAICMCNLVEISKIPQSLKDNIEIVVFTNQELFEIWNQRIPMFIQAGLNIRTSHCRTNNYMQRTAEACSTGSRYSCRLDDDLFMSCHVWEFMLLNIRILERPDIIHYTPEFTTGIPTVDFFIEDFLDEDKKNEIAGIFIRDNIPVSPWHGVDFSHIQEKVKNYSDWNVQAYYDEVWLNKTIFKGVHPIRFSNDANLLICKEVINNFQKFISKQDYRETRILNNIHFTHFLFFKTENWVNSLQNRFDDFDEISMNQYAIKNNMGFAVPKNSFAIHTAHGYVDNQKIIEDMYTECLLNNNQINKR